MSNVVNKILGGGSAPAKVAQAAAGMTKRKPQEFGQIKVNRRGRRAGRSLLFSNDETGVKSTTLG